MDQRLRVGKEGCTSAYTYHYVSSLLCTTLSSTRRFLFFFFNKSISSLTGELETKDKYMVHLHFNPKQGWGGETSFRNYSINSNSA